MDIRDIRIKDVIKTAVILSGAAYMIGFGGYKTLRDALSGGKVFDGKIEGKSVKYYEHIWSPILAFGNYMTIEKGNSKYWLKDTKGGTSIAVYEDDAPDFENDELEAIVIKDKYGREKFISKTADDDTLKGKASKELFDEFNPTYNKIRARIRAKIREKYSDIKAYRSEKMR